MMIPIKLRGERNYTLQDSIRKKERKSKKKAVNIMDK